MIRASYARAALLELRGLLEGYAAIFFLRGPWFGLATLAATLVVPRQSLLGLIGAITGRGVSAALGLDQDTRGVFYTMNGLLVGLALGLYYRPSPPLALLLVVTVALTVVSGAAARAISETYLAVPVLSLPFVLGTWGALLAARRFTGIEFTLEPILAGQTELRFVPHHLALFLKSLGAPLFQVNVISGLVVLVALAIVSRWTVILAILGYVAGTATYLALGGLGEDLTRHLLGFNFILAAIAVGGVYVVLSPWSMLLAAAAGTMAAGMSAAMASALDPLHLPVLAMPFIVVTHAVIYALGRRAGRPRLVEGAPASPEENLVAAVDRDVRYPPKGPPLLLLPVSGTWWVSQGNDGDHTHKGPWRHAWDLEVVDHEGRTYRTTGETPQDYLCYGLPVYSPGAGQVVHAVGHLPDNPIGEVDLANNWGNYVVVWHGGGFYSLVAHLAPGSVAVTVGQRVEPGQLLGKVGNTGRSPRPHLHLHVQTGPLPGTPTIPARLLHYLELPGPGEEATTATYRSHGLPAEGSQVAPVTMSERVRELVAFPPGATWTWEVRTDGEVTRETWRVELDLLGRRHIESSTNGVAQVYEDRHYTTVVSYRRGRRRELLGLLALGCPRVPHTTESITWTDRLQPGPYMTWPRRVLHEIALPFTSLGEIRTTSRLRVTDQGVALETDLDPVGTAKDLDLPRAISLSFGERWGLREIRADLGPGGTLVATRVEVDR